MTEWFIRLLRLIQPKDKLVRVKSWRPSWDGRHRCPAWPLMVVDCQGGSRFIGQPLWDRARWRDVFRIPEKPEPPMRGTM